MNRCSVAQAQQAFERYHYQQSRKLGSEQVEEMLRTFARFDKDGSGFIEANEMASLKKMFSIEEVDVNVKDGKIDQVELLAALNKCSLFEARLALDHYNGASSSSPSSFLEQMSNGLRKWFG
jgi:hypothetical protein